MQEKYDTIGENYNSTRKADSYIFNQLLLHLNPSFSGNYLDIGCGTGNYTSEFAKKGYSFIGIDPSSKMLAKAKTQNHSISWKSGTAENTQLPSQSIDGIVASLTIHHWQDLTLAFSELNRVLKQKATIVIFTSTPEQMKGYWLNHYFPKMLQDSIIQMPSYNKIETSVNEAGLQIENTEKYEIRDDLKDLFLYSGKHHPELYTDPSVRQGISSFSSLANADEVKKGLLALEKDIDSGKINDIIAAYANTKGDYLFMTIKKV